jgi:cytochrome c-type protein NapC
MERHGEIAGDTRAGKMMMSSMRSFRAHERFLFTGKKTCIDCHKGIAHKLPDMKGVEGWQ